MVWCCLHAQWEEWRLQQEARQAELEAARVLRQQQEAWASMVLLGSKLATLRQQLLQDRSSRMMCIRHKEAAVRISTWYKSILVRRCGWAGMYLLYRYMCVPRCGGR